METIEPGQIYRSATHGFRLLVERIEDLDGYLLIDTVDADDAGDLSVPSEQYDIVQWRELVRVYGMSLEQPG